MAFKLKGYGNNKGIPATCIAGGTFDVILCIIVLGITTTVTFNRIESDGNGGLVIGMLFVELVTGLGIGVIMALLSWVFKFIPHKPTQMWVKAIYCLAFAVGDVVAV